MNMIGHEMPFQNFHTFVFAQILKNIPNAFELLCKNYFPSIVWCKYDMVFTPPTGMSQTLSPGSHIKHLF